MLQFSSLLEAQVQKLRRDALKLINSTITSTATTNLWQLLKSFFGVDKEPDEEDLQDAVSLTAAIRARKQEQEHDVKAKSLNNCFSTLTQSSKSK